MNWVIMPYLGNLDQTEQAAYDVLDQSLPDVHLLLIQQGGDPVALGPGAVTTGRAHHWHHDPPLPSLAATWNRALRMVWAGGGTQALVVNNDVRLPRQLYEALAIVQKATQAWFVSACNVGEAAWTTVPTSLLPFESQVLFSRGGPDFSCFLITRQCHVNYPFDEGFQPAYCEDLDYHRRLMLDGKGDTIFSVQIPYLHFASGTLKGMTPEARERKEQQINAGSRAYYEKKWGGPVNHERWSIPFDALTDRDGVTTPELQHGRE